MQDDRWSKEDEDLPVMALSLSGVAFQCHIKITVPKQATNPEKGSFPWVRGSFPWVGFQKELPKTSHGSFDIAAEMLHSRNSGSYELFFLWGKQLNNPFNLS